MKIGLFGLQLIVIHLVIAVILEVYSGATQGTATHSSQLL